MEMRSSSDRKSVGTKKAAPAARPHFCRRSAAWFSRMLRIAFTIDRT